VVDVNVINTFETRLDKHWLNEDIYSFYFELTGTGSASSWGLAAGYQRASPGGR